MLRFAAIGVFYFSEKPLKLATNIGFIRTGRTDPRLMAFYRSGIRERKGCHRVDLHYYYHYFLRRGSTADDRGTGAVHRQPVR